MSLPPIYWSTFTWEAFATLTTGILAVGAAVYVGTKQQKITAKQLQNEQLRLRMELFDRRFEFYALLEKYIQATRRRSGPTLIMERNFTEESRRSRLLFPNKVRDIIEDIASLGDEYQDLYEDKNSIDQVIRNNALKRRTQIRKLQEERFKEFEEIADRIMRLDS